MESLPDISQEEFLQELLTETLQKASILEQQNLRLRLQLKKMQEDSAEDAKKPAKKK